MLYNACALVLDCDVGVWWTVLKRSIRWKSVPRLVLRSNSHNLQSDYIHVVGLFSPGLCSKLCITLKRCWNLHPRNLIPQNPSKNLAIISIWCYKWYFRHVELRAVLFWSLPWCLCLNNHAFGCFSFDTVYSKLCVGSGGGLMMTIIGEFILMLLVVLSARICPEGIEGTFTFIISIQNLSESLATNGDPWWFMFWSHSWFTHLWKVMVPCHLCDIIPLMVIQFVPKDRELRGRNTTKDEIEIPLDESKIQKTMK